MFQLIISPLGQLMYVCYRLTGNYGSTILLFTLLIKIIFLPLSLWQQKNSIKMVQIQPEVNRIKAQYINDSAQAGEAQLALYKEAGYNPLIGLIPTLIQIPLIIGVISAVYNPLTYLLKMEPAMISMVKEQLIMDTGTEKVGLAWQLKAINLSETGALTHLLPEFLEGLSNFNHSWNGLDLLKVPALTNGFVIFPIMAVFSTLLLCVLQNRSNVLQREQGFLGQWGTTAIMVALAVYLSFAVPAAVVLYWAIGNLLAIFIMYLLNIIMNPRKYVDYDQLEKSKVLLKEAEKNKKSKKEIRANALKCKADYKRFLAGGKKELVFYSVRGGFYRYYKGLIEHILAGSDIVIHYVTSDVHDDVFTMQIERFIPYYIDGNNLIYWFMKLDADIVVMTMPEIEKYYYKRSIVRKDIDYVYVFHAMVSTHMIYRQGAFDHYDTIFCVGPHHEREIRETEALYGLPRKKLISFGYPMLDDLRESYQQMVKKEDTFQILIAPSHHEGNIMDSCIEALLESVAGHGWRVIVRPHPQYVKRNAHRVEELEKSYGKQGVFFETDFSKNESQYTSDVMITDWSGISMEYSFTTLKPCIYINTPMKVLNPEWQKLKSRPALLEIRNQIGVAFDPDRVSDVGNAIREIQEGRILKEESIAKIVNQYVYHLGSHGKTGAEYIINEIHQIRKKAKG